MALCLAELTSNVLFEILQDLVEAERATYIGVDQLYCFSTHATSSDVVIHKTTHK